jgi:peptidoglycan hydrolase-like protein with peptidoglycan-binding domain
MGRGGINTLHKTNWYIVPLFILSLALCLCLVSTEQASAADPMRNLYQGCNGNDVTQLQNDLNLKGYYCGTADGKFGSRTRAAVLALQKENNCAADAIVGPQTRQALASYQPRLLLWGSAGGDVARLQQALNERGYSCGAVDGKFGSRTYNAVINFQKASNCQPDGKIGSQTRQALANYKPDYTPPSRGGGETPTRYVKTLTMKATAYCPCSKCNYPYAGQPSAIGLPLKKGIVAVDPRVIKLGTRLYVEGYGAAIAADTGGAIKGNRIDLCFNSHSEALKWGIQNVKVYVLP